MTIAGSVFAPSEMGDVFTVRRANMKHVRIGEDNEVTVETFDGNIIVGTLGRIYFPPAVSWVERIAERLVSDGINDYDTLLEGVRLEAKPHLLPYVQIGTGALIIPHAGGGLPSGLGRLVYFDLGATIDTVGVPWLSIGRIEPRLCLSEGSERDRIRWLASALAELVLADVLDRRLDDASPRRVGQRSLVLSDHYVAESLQPRERIVGDDRVGEALAEVLGPLPRRRRGRRVRSSRP